MKHTKGPWKANLVPRLNVKGPDGKSICAIVAAAGKVTRPYEEHCSNALLIAASPELLEIAKAYRNLLKTMAHTDGEVATYHHINDVISKIEGK